MFSVQLSVLILLLGVALSAAQEVVTGSHLETPESREVCFGETFHGQCADNRTVHVDSARYGRMRAGRCVDREHGYIGCEADVSVDARRICDGLQSCNISVPQATFHAERPCPPDLTPWLEIAYSCVPAGVHEVCALETLNASCAWNERVVVRSARYGRMRLGRCVQREYGHVGCSEDVAQQADELCSEQQSCLVDPLHPTFHATSPCPRDLMAYLEVAYDCVPRQMEEFCAWETFRASCGDGERVAVRWAHYGRMRVGRCILADSGPVGCSADVTLIAAELCSVQGASSCTIDPRHRRFQAATPCPDDLRKYLAINYDCVPGGYQEVCRSGSFNASCASGERLIVRSARYGRMRRGRCIRYDYDIIGCSADATEIANRICSEQQSCHIDNIARSFRDLGPCELHLPSYLEISYHCVAESRSRRELTGSSTRNASAVARSSGPVIVEHPQNLSVERNEPAVLNCKADGDPRPVITWYRNGAPVVTADDDPTSHRLLLLSGQLFFMRIEHNENSQSDVGVYYCNATNPLTGVSAISRNAAIQIATG